jgi:hypothetical protein
MADDLAQKPTVFKVDQPLKSAPGLKGGEQFVPVERHTFGEKAIAEFRTGTALGSVTLDAPELTNIIDRGFLPTVPEGREDFASDYAKALNQDDWGRIDQDITKAIKLKATAAELPMLAQLGIQLLDPINYASFAGILSKVKASSDIATSAMQGSLQAVLGTAAQEGVISQNDITRTLGESGLNIGFAAGIGGTLGAAFHGTYGVIAKEKNSSPGQVKADVEEDINIELFGNVNDSMEALKARGMTEEEAAQEIFLRGNGSEQIAEMSQNVEHQSGGAAAVERTIKTLEESGLKLNPAVKAFLHTPFARQSLQLRLITSDNQLSREVVQHIAEMGEYLDVNFKNQAGPQSIETNVKLWAKGEANVNDIMRQAHSEMVFNRDPKLLDDMRVRFGKDDRMTFSEFKEKVFESSASMQPTGIKVIDDAADKINDEFFAPTLERLKATGLVDKDTTGTEFRRNYVPIFYDMDALNNPKNQKAFLKDTRQSMIDEKKEAQVRVMHVDIELQPKRDDLKQHVRQVKSLEKSIKENMAVMKENMMDNAMAALDKVQVLPSTKGKSKPSQKQADAAARKAFKDAFELEMGKVVDAANVSAFKSLTWTDATSKVLKDAFPDASIELDKITDSIGRSVDKHVPPEHVAQVNESVKLELDRVIKDATREAAEAHKKSIDAQAATIKKNGKTLSPDEAANKLAREMSQKVKNAYERRVREAVSKATKESKENIHKLTKEIDEIRKRNDHDMWKAETDFKEIEIIAERRLSDLRGTPVGRIGHNEDTFKVTSNVKGGKPGSTKQVKWKVPMSTKMPYIVKDMGQVVSRYTRTIAPEVEIRESPMFAVDDTEFFNALPSDDSLRDLMSDSDPTGAKMLWDIRESWLSKMSDARSNNKSSEILANMDKQMKQDLKDVKDALDIVRNQYGIPEDPLSMKHRIPNFLINWSYVKSLGGMVVSALTDPAKIIMRNGFARTYSSVLKPMIADIKGFNLSRREIRRGIGVVEYMMNTRVKQAANLMDDHARFSKAEKAMGYISDTFGKYTGMAYWNQFMKEMSGVTSQERMIRAMYDDARPGPMKRDDEILLRWAGIEPADSKAITDLIDVHGDGDYSVILPNINAWENLPNGTGPAKKLRAAVTKDIDTTIVTPGMDRPTMTRDGYMRMVTQFQSFGFSSVEKTFIPAMQNPDKAMFSGLTVQVSLGMMVYALKTLQSGKELSDDPTEWLREGLDRGGSFGVLMNYNNMLEKVSRGHIGLGPMMGIDKEVSRFQSRGVAESVIGPWYGIAKSSAEVVGSLLSGESPNGHTLRTLMPYQNHTALSKGFDLIEGK